MLIMTLPGKINFTVNLFIELKGIDEYTGGFVVLDDILDCN